MAQQGVILKAKIKKEEKMTYRTLAFVAGILSIIASLSIWRGVVVTRDLSVETNQRRHLELVAEAAILIAKIKDGDGSINEQRWNIEKLSFIIQNTLVSSEELGQEGQWVGELRRVVNNREAVEALAQLRDFELKAKSLNDAEMSKAEKLFNIVSKRVDTVDNKGAQISHGDLWRIMYNIRHKGESPL